MPSPTPAGPSTSSSPQTTTTGSRSGAASPTPARAASPCSCSTTSVTQRAPGRAPWERAQGPQGGHPPSRARSAIEPLSLVFAAEKVRAVAPFRKGSRWVAYEAGCRAPCVFDARQIEAEQAAARPRRGRRRRPRGAVAAGAGQARQGDANGRHRGPQRCAARAAEGDGRRPQLPRARHPRGGARARSPEAPTAHARPMPEGYPRPLQRTGAWPPGAGTANGHTGNGNDNGHLSLDADVLDNWERWKGGER